MFRDLNEIYCSSLQVEQAYVKVMKDFKKTQTTSYSTCKIEIYQIELFTGSQMCIKTSNR